MKGKNSGLGIAGDNYVIPQIEIKYHPVVTLNKLPSIGARSAAEYFRETWDREEKSIQKKVRIMVLSKRYQVLGIYETIDCPNVMRLDPKYVFMAAINKNACAVAIAITHNSVSESYNPDFDELNFLNKLLIGGKYLGIDIWDFVLMARDDHFSFREHGFLDKQVIDKRKAGLGGILCPKATDNFQTVFKSVSLENIFKESYQCNDLCNEIEKLCYFNDPLRDEVCSQINGPLAEEIVFLLAVMAEKKKLRCENDSKLQSDDLNEKKDETGIKEDKQKNIIEENASAKSNPLLTTGTISQKLESVNSQSNGIEDIYQLIAAYKQHPELIKGAVRTLTIKSFWRPSSKEWWLQNNGKAGTECCQITLLGNWISKTGFCIHEKVQVIPLQRMLIIIPE